MAMKIGSANRVMVRPLALLVLAGAALAASRVPPLSPTLSTKQ
jgi:hypothetical protein